MDNICESEMLEVNDGDALVWDFGQNMARMLSLLFIHQ